MDSCSPDALRGMLAAIDWPAWANVILVAGLAGITFWYARTTAKTYEHLQLERDDRLRMIRQPYVNVVDECEQLLFAAESLLAASVCDDAMHGDIVSRAQYLDGEKGKLVEDVRLRSEATYRGLQQLREDCRDLEKRVTPILRRLKARESVATHDREALSERLHPMREHIVAARAAVAKLW